MMMGRKADFTAAGPILGIKSPEPKPASRTIGRIEKDREMRKKRKMCFLLKNFHEFLHVSVFQCVFLFNFSTGSLLKKWFG